MPGVRDMDINGNEVKCVTIIPKVNYNTKS